MATNYVAPATKIYILKGIPFDNTFTHTIYFPNINAQTNYFTSRRKVFDDAPIPFDDTDCTYQRQDNLIKIAHNAEQIRDCNYLMYQNRGFGNKWFYAFITGVHHSNNTCTWVTFEIDPLQTFMFDIDILPCLVEREHSANDIAGANTEPEPVSIERYTHIEAINVTTSIDLNTTPVALTRYEQAGTMTREFDPGYLGHKYSGLAVKSGEEVKDLLKSCDGLYAEKIAKGIGGIYECPRAFVPRGVTPEPTYPDKKSLTCSNLVSLANTVSPSPLLDNYTPNNKKLYTYPYTSLVISTQISQPQEYKYEMFSSITSDPNLISFTGMGYGGMPPEVIIVPRNYEGKAYNYDERIAISFDSPTPWVNDTYKAWAAQQAIKTAVNLIIAAGVIKTFGGFSAGSLSPSTALSTDVLPGDSLSRAFSADIYGASSPSKLTPGSKALLHGIGAHTVGNLVGGGLTRGDVAHATTGGGNAMIANNVLTPIKVYTKCPRYHELRKIDKFFDMYGYTCNDLKVPNIHSRPHWNYVKTKFANIIPKQGTNTGITNEHLVKIRDIFNGGITFWKNPTEVGNYNLDNRVGALPPTDIFTITFTPNGGTGTMPNGTAYAGIPYIFPENAFTPPTGKQFTYWNTDSTSEPYYPGNSILITRDTTIAPIWEPVAGTQYTIHFEPNGGRVLENMPDETISANDWYTLPFNEYYFPPLKDATEDFYSVFESWRVYDDEFYEPGQTAQIVTNVNCIAHWRTGVHPDDRIDIMLSVAERQIGKPYVSGGNGPQNFDCSGLIYYCLNMANYVVGDKTANGYAHFNFDDGDGPWLKITANSKAEVLPELRPGDLVFFWNANRTKIQHCGIFVGNDQMIHASSAGTVRKVSFTGYSSLVWAWACRPQWYV